MCRGRKCGYLHSTGNHTEDLIEFDNPIFDTRVDQHDTMSDSMCIELDQSGSSEESSGPPVVKQQWRSHTIQCA